MIGPKSDLRKLAREIAESWLASRGERPKNAKRFTQEEIDAVEEMRIAPDGRVNGSAEKLHSAMVMHNAKLGADPAPAAQANESGQAPTP